MPFAVEQAVKLEYSSAYAPHVMIIPVRPVSALTTSPTTTELEAWDATTVILGDMVDNLVAELVEYWPITVNVNVATLLITDPEDEVLVPAFSWTIDEPGVYAAPGWSKAVQQTVIMRTASHNIFKLVQLDVGSNDDWSPIVSLGVEPNLDAIVQELADDEMAWSGRDNAQPTTFIKATKTLNDTLRRQYRMS